MGQQQAAVGAAAGAARQDQRGRAREVGRLALAVAAGVVVGAGVYAVADRVVEVDGQDAVVAVEDDRGAAADLAGEKAALLAAGADRAGARVVDSATDAANVLAQEKAALGVEAAVVSGAAAADRANARVRADAAYRGGSNEGEGAATAEAANRLRQSGG